MNQSVPPQNSLNRILEEILVTDVKNFPSPLQSSRLPLIPNFQVSYPNFHSANSTPTFPSKNSDVSELLLDLKMMQSVAQENHEIMVQELRLLENFFAEKFPHVSFDSIMPQIDDVIANKSNILKRHRENQERALANAKRLKDLEMEKIAKIEEEIRNQKLKLISENKEKIAEAMQSKDTLAKAPVVDPRNTENFKLKDIKDRQPVSEKVKEDKQIASSEERANAGPTASNTGAHLKIKLVAPKVKDEAPDSSTGASRSFKQEIDVKSSKAKRKDSQTNQSSKNIDGTSKPKIPNQVPITAFWSYIDGYFRPFNEDDLRFLQNNEPSVDCFLMPQLGKHYKAQWDEEDRKAIGYSTTSSGIPKRTSEEPTLRERLISSLLEEKIISNKELSQLVNDENNAMDVDTDQTVPSIPDYNSLEERLKRELKSLGIMEHDANSQGNENDEICLEIRSLQARLREQQIINQYRKNKITEHVKRHLIYQDYASVLDEVDKHFEIIFGKRLKGIKKKKKSGSSSQNQSRNSLQGFNIHQLLEKRKLLVRKFQDVIPKPDEIAIPQHSIYHDEEMKKELASQSFDLFTLPSLPLKRALPAKSPAFLLSEKVANNK